MSLSLLWLGLTLLWAPQTQAQRPNLIPAPPLLKVPLQPDFQDDQFQGKWYVLGLAGNAVTKEEQGQFKMYTTTYELKEDGSYNVTSTRLVNKKCFHWIRTFVPSFQPGQFNLGSIKNFQGVQSYTVRVAATNYNQYAIVFFKKVFNNQEYFKTTLYGRTKELTPELKENFIRFAKSLGLTDDHIIYPVPIGNGQSGEAEGDMRTVQACAATQRKGLVGACPDGSFFWFGSQCPELPLPLSWVLLS
ncbi:PREDICTED: neutrophil gelatinase-associated lipocalin [Chrysochloris asiatica]|uniref:Neutrophil gelatinase-associated lipocalin n=1 Tax=Chrysochloris asiatica TaxID=185453 RepID=A0A9B0TAM7_CHRAS|nr:PREDICTED: neutrophil gelatinase-associated lipocalin [Chrysochloris asiatica]